MSKPTKIYTIKWCSDEQTTSMICQTCWQEVLDDMVDDIVSWSEVEGKNYCEFCADHISDYGHSYVIARADASQDDG